MMWSETTTLRLVWRKGTETRALASQRPLSEADFAISANAKSDQNNVREEY